MIRAGFDPTADPEPVNPQRPPGTDLQALLGKRQAFEHSIEQLGLFLEESLDEMFVVDAESLRFIEVNKAARSHLGYTLEELRRLTPIALVPELTTASFRERLAPLESGEKLHIELTTVCQRKDGSVHPCEIHLHRCSVGDRPVFIALMLDLTRRRAEQEEAGNRDAWAATILNTTADAILTIDPSGIIQALNPATLRLFGFEESELLGKNVRVLMPPAVAQFHDGYLQRYIETGEAHIIGQGRTLEAQRKDGSVFPIRLNVGEARHGSGRFFTGIIHDLTAEKQMEAERDDGARRLRALFQQRLSLTGVCSPDGILVDVNRAALDYVGVESSDVLGRHFWETPWWTHDPELQRRLRSALARAAKGSFVRFDATHPRRDGSLGLVDFSITPVMGENGRLDVLLVESVDITEKRNLQEQLVRSQKMEAIGTLAGGIAHDFNNLLTSIRGSAEILRDHLEEHEDLRGNERLSRSAARILKASDRAAELTRRILGLSRKQVTQRRPIDLNHAVRETRELFARTLPEDVEVKMDLAGEPLYARVDDSQLGQVLMNLVVNAGDAMPKGGCLLLSTIRSRVEGERARSLDLVPGDYVEIRVSDTGEGMTPETLARIFDPFFTTKAVGKGTGLGLAMSMLLVREHGGAIEVESEPGVGSSFNVLLPEVDAPVMRSSPMATLEESAETPASGQTILLVEDDEIMRELVTEVLEGGGYRVIRAAGPDQALDASSVHDGAIDLVVTDVVMPGMGGFELARRLRSGHPTLRILYMSGYTDQELSERGELDDDDAFIRKPFGIEDLLVKVRAVLDAAPPESDQAG